MQFLNQQTVKSLLSLPALIEALAPAMIDLSQGKVSMPQRIAAFVEEKKGLLGCMPAYLPNQGILCTKLVSVFPENSRNSLPVHQAIIALFDSENGKPLIMMDGAYITAMRTAAGSALATKILAKQDATILVIIGTSVQAMAHLKMIPLVRSIKEIRIVGRNFEKAGAFAKEASTETNLPVVSYSNFKKAAVGADIICATTHSKEPVVLGGFLEPGVHINSVGLHPKGRELDNATIVNGKIVVESISAALSPHTGGANDLILPIAKGLISEKDIHAEIGEILAGIKAGRTNDMEKTIYKSVGVAVQDAVAAGLVFSKAKQKGIL